MVYSSLQAEFMVTKYDGHIHRYGALVYVVIIHFLSYIATLIALCITMALKFREINDRYSKFLLVDCCYTYIYYYVNRLMPQYKHI